MFGAGSPCTELETKQRRASPSNSRSFYRAGDPTQLLRSVCALTTGGLIRVGRYSLAVLSCSSTSTREVACLPELPPRLHLISPLRRTKLSDEVSQRSFWIRLNREKNLPKFRSLCRSSRGAHFKRLVEERLDPDTCTFGSITKNAKTSDQIAEVVTAAVDTSGSNPPSEPVRVARGLESSGPHAQRSARALATAHPQKSY